MIGDSFQNRMQEKAPNVDIAIPMNLKGEADLLQLLVHFEY